MRVVLSSVVGALLAGASFGCSSVPEVTFAEPDASASTIADATTDTTDPVDASKAEDAGTTYSCPAHPPPFTTGVCCGARLCLKCNIFQCDRCEKEACKAPDVCCARNPMTTGNSISCQSAASCN